jgi:pimeloyl-ACP methyl ester carboxylesterase
MRSALIDSWDVEPFVVRTPDSTLAAERFFNVQRWTEMPEDGHFAALETPELLVKEIREFFRPLRQ